MTPLTSRIIKHRIGAAMLSAPILLILCLGTWQQLIYLGYAIIAVIWIALTCWFLFA